MKISARPLHQTRFGRIWLPWRYWNRAPGHPCTRCRSLTKLSRLTDGAWMTLYPPAALKTLRAAQFPRSAPNHSSSATFPAQRLNEAASLRRDPAWFYREYGWNITVAKFLVALILR